MWQTTAVTLAMSIVTADNKSRSPSVPLCLRPGALAEEGSSKG